DAVLVTERQVPGGVCSHEVEHPASQLVVVDPRVPRRGDRVDGPRCVAFDEELLLVSTLATKPEVDRVRRDRRGQGPEVFRRAASDASELLEAPVRQAESNAGCVVEDERIGGDSLGPKVDRVNRVRVETLATAACGLMECRDAGVP